MAGEERIRPVEAPKDKQAPLKPVAVSPKLTARQEREAAALRANLGKRKDQARARDKPKKE